MNKYLKIQFLLILSVLSVLLLSGCSHHHYSRRDAIKWFQETYVDEKLVVSRDYTERKNSSGYTDKVWKAHLKELPEVEFELISHLKELPEVEFELISHKYYSLFTQYDLKTSYELEMASYYLEQYQKLQDVETESLYNEKLAINGIYHTVQEMENLCKELGDFDDYYPPAYYQTYYTWYVSRYVGPESNYPAFARCPGWKADYGTFGWITYSVAWLNGNWQYNIFYKWSLFSKYNPSTSRVILLYDGIAQATDKNHCTSAERFRNAAWGRHSAHAANALYYDGSVRQTDRSYANVDTNVVAK